MEGFYSFTREFDGGDTVRLLDHGIETDTFRVEPASIAYNRERMDLLDSDDAQQIIDKLADWYLHDNEDRSWVAREEADITDQMQYDLGTVRALKLAIIRKPSSELFDETLDRTTNLFERDIVFSVPFLGVLSEINEDYELSLREKVFELLDTDTAVGDAFMRSVKNFGEAPWVREGALKAAKNPALVDTVGIPKGLSGFRPSLRDRYYWLGEQEWYPELAEAAKLTRDSQSNEAYEHAGQLLEQVNDLCSDIDATYRSPTLRTELLRVKATVDESSGFIFNELDVAIESLKTAHIALAGIDLAKRHDLATFEYIADCRSGAD